MSESSVNEEKRTVDLTWTTGAKGLRSGWGERYYEELSLAPEHVDLSRLNDGSHPLLAAHDDRSLDSVIGVVERAWLEGDKAGATVRFAKDEISERVFQKVKDGILRNVSVGYSVQEYTDVSQEGDEYPTFRATRWTPAELSIVPIGFDAQAKVRNDELTENEVEIISTRSAEPTIEEIPQMTEEQKKQLAQEAAAAERARVLEIRKAVKEANLPEDMANEYIERGTSTEEARTNISLFAKYAKEQEATRVASVTRVEIGETDADKKRDGLEQALLHRVDGSNFQVTEASKPFYGKSLLRMLEEVVGRRIGETDAQLAKRAMGSSDLPQILANVAEKSAQKRYELQPRTFQRWTKSATLRNYKEATQLRAGDFSSLLERKENGEYQHGSFGEEYEVAQLADYGIKHAFTNKMLVNDDLSMIMKVASESGVATARLENKKAYAALTTNKTMKDSVALYHATHGNLGTAAAIGEASFTEAFKFMRKQKSVGGLDPLNLTPKFLICGPDKETEARKFLMAIQPTQTSNVNIFSGSVELVVDAEITGNQYYFAADPQLIDTVSVFRLEGQEGPRVESRINWDTDALELKVAHTVAAEPMDWRGLIKNAGA